MNRRTTASNDPDIIASAKALRRAARRALGIGLSTRTPVYVMKAGNIVDLTKTVPMDDHRVDSQTVRETGGKYGTKKPLQTGMSLPSSRRKARS